MSLNSKRTMASLTAGALVVAAYLIFAMGATAPHGDNLKAWAAAMLVFIGVGIAAMIMV